MKNFKRTMAALVAMTMTMSTAGVIASAEDVTGVTGGGKVEDIIDIEIFDIDLPTIPADNAKVFDFILDPQLLIGATNGDALGTFDALDDTATLLFKNVIGAQAEIPAKSIAALTVDNNHMIDDPNAAGNQINDGKYAKQGDVWHKVVYKHGTTPFVDPNGRGEENSFAEVDGTTWTADGNGYAISWETEQVDGSDKKYLIISKNGGSQIWVDPTDSMIEDNYVEINVENDGVKYVDDGTNSNHAIKQTKVTKPIVYKMDMSTGFINPNNSLDEDEYVRIDAYVIPAVPAVPGQVKWSNESDSLTAYNRSNAPVNLEVKATVTDAEGITFVSGYKKDEDGKVVKDGNGESIVATPEEDKAQIKLSFIGGDDDDEFEFVQAEDGTISATLTAEIAEIDDSNFTTKYTAGASGAKGTYEHVLKNDFDLSTTPSYSFKLVGEASKNINGKAWTSLKSKAPKLAVTWKITDTRTVSGEPTVPETVAGNATSLKIDVEMGNATEIKSIEHMMGSATTWTAFPSPSNGVPYAFADGKITFGANQSKALSTNGAKLRITFDDGSTTGVQKVVTVQKIS